jgi:DNA primase
MKGKKFELFKVKMRGIKFEEKKEEFFSEPTRPIISKKTGQKFILNLKKKGRKAFDYLKKGRGFSEQAIEYFKLGSYKKYGDECVSIPFYDREDIALLKYRKIKPRDKKDKWIRELGGASILFNLNALSDPELKSVFICEAELDAVSLYSNGFENVVSVSTGATSAAKHLPYAKFENLEKIYLCFDSDEPGQQAAKEVARVLGMQRCFNILLPSVKDVNEYFYDSQSKKQRKSKTDFEALINTAKRF